MSIRIEIARIDRAIANVETVMREIVQKSASGVTNAQAMRGNLSSLNEDLIVLNAIRADNVKYAASKPKMTKEDVMAAAEAVEVPAEKEKAPAVKANAALTKEV